MSSLERCWTTLYRETLPRLATSKSSVQTCWPVSLDHCFARIILDAVVGRGETYNSLLETMSATDECTHSPWTTKLKAPAVKNMTEENLEHCIALAGALIEGKVNIVELDEKSLKVRGKASKTNGVKRKWDQVQEVSSIPKTAIRPSRSGESQRDIRSAFGAILPLPATMPLAVTIETDLANRIEASKLTPFRKQVLMALCQVPKGQISSYLALSNHLGSSPRAVGNALRNNPFAPNVPCHRIVAANGSIGGFGGSWGLKGKHYEKKVTLLKEEGVDIEERDGKIRSVLWEGFV